MISADLRFEGFDSRSWTHLVSLFAPNVVTRLDSEVADTTEAEDAEGSGYRGSLVIVLDDRERVLKAFHTERGRITGLQYGGPDSLAELAREHRAPRCVVLREGVMEEIGERIARRITRHDDYIAQLLVIARSVREMSEAGLLLTWPRPLGNVPIPTIGMVRRTLDTVLPDETAMVLVVFQNGAPWTAMVLRRREGLIDLIAGPDLVVRWAGALGGDWRRDYRVISDAVARQVAPVHLGVFTERDTLIELLRSKDSGAWAKAVGVRDVIVHPAPPYVSVALGADAVRAVAKRSAAWLGGIDALGQFAPLARFVRGRIAEVASVNATLGFDPLQVLATWLRRAEAAEFEGWAEDIPPGGPSTGERPSPSSVADRSDAVADRSDDGDAPPAD